MSSLRKPGTHPGSKGADIMKFWTFFATLFSVLPAYAGVSVSLQHTGIGNAHICDAGIWHPGASADNPLHQFENVSATKTYFDAPDNGKVVVVTAGTSAPKKLVLFYEQFQMYFTDLEFSMFSPEFGTRYFVDVCTRLPEIEELQNQVSSSFADYELAGTALIDPNWFFDEVPEGSYAAESKLEVQSQIHCDMNTPNVASEDYFPIGIDWKSLNKRVVGASDVGLVSEEAIPFVVKPLPVLSTFFGPTVNAMPRSCVIRYEFFEAHATQDRTSFEPVKFNLMTSYKLNKLN